MMAIIEVVSGAILIVFLTSLRVTWPNNATDNAQEQSDPVPGREQIIPMKEMELLGTVANQILTDINDRYYNDTISELRNRKETPLNNTEVWYKVFYWSQIENDPKYQVPEGEKLPQALQDEKEGRVKKLEQPGYVREKLVHQMQNADKNKMTIAVGVDEAKMEIVVAGNIKKSDYSNLTAKVEKVANPNEPSVSELKKSKAVVASANILRVGFEDPGDYDIVRKIAAKAYPNYKVIVVSPSEDKMDEKAKSLAAEVVKTKTDQIDKEMIKNNTKFQPPVKQPIEQEEMKIKAQYFPADMQIKVFFEKQRGGSLGKKIKASKPYCERCLEEMLGKIDESEQQVLNKVVQWGKLEDVNATDLGTPTPLVDEHAAKIKEDIKWAGECGASGCGNSLTTLRGGTCSSLRDYTEIDAERASAAMNGMQELTERQRLLAVLDRVGMQKLKGSESAMNGVTKDWKQWKSTSAKQIMTSVSEGTVLHGHHRGGTSAADLERVAISRYFFLLSLNKKHESDLELLSKNYNNFKDVEEEKYPKQLVGLRAGYNFVKTVKLGLFGKDLIGGILEGDVKRMAKTIGIFAGDRILTKTGNVIAARGLDMAQAGRTAMGKGFQVAGPIVGSLSVGFSIYSLVRDVKHLNYIKKFCERDDAFFKDRLEKDCQYDMHIAEANVIQDSVSITSSVGSTALSVMAAFEIGGPAGPIIIGVVDAVVMLRNQIDIAEQTNQKTSSSIVGGLTPSEKYLTFWDSFLGIKPPKNIQKLLELKASYNKAVKIAAKALEEALSFTTSVSPTIQPNIETVQFKDNSDANFRDTKELNRFRVQPDEPSWGKLKCKPNSVYNAGYPDDPEIVPDETDSGPLCHNVIAFTDPDRSDLPVLVDLKDGNDTFVGFSKLEHVFIVGNGTKKFTGGDANDVFFIRGHKFLGKLDGGEGTNKLVVNSEAESAIAILRYGFKYPAEGTSESYVKVRNIQQILGRQGREDWVDVDCSSTTYIDLKGAVAEESRDEILFQTEECRANITLQLHNWTYVKLPTKQEGIFTYIVEFGLKTVIRGLPSTATAVNQIIFSNDIYKALLFIEPSASGNLLWFYIRNYNERKEFASEIRPCDENSIFRTKSGLRIMPNKDCTSFYGLAFFEPDMILVEGFKNHPNHFILGSEAKEFPRFAVGGDKDDILSINVSSSKEFHFNGSSGIDSIVIQQNYFSSKRVHIKFVGKYPAVGPELSEGFDAKIFLAEVENLIGRPALPETAVVKCDFNFLDLKGGKDLDQRDIVQIVSEPSCTPKITIMVNSYTNVSNDATSGEFHYIIGVESPQTSNISVISDGNANHNYIFNTTGSSVVGIDFDRASRHLTIQLEEGSSFEADLLPRQSYIYLADATSVTLSPIVQGVIQANYSHYVVTKTGLHFAPNFFWLNAAPKGSKCTGGEKNDTFFLESEEFHGDINGGEGGMDSIVLGNELWKDRSMIIDANAQTVSGMEESKPKYQIQMRNISRFIGREKQTDGVVAGCDTTLIDTRGASSFYDLIQISPYLECSYELGMAIRPNLVIFNDAEDGDFEYEGSFEGGKTFIFMTFSDFVNHKIILSMDFLQLEQIQLKGNRVNMTAKNDFSFSTDVFFAGDEQTQSQPSIVFQDGLQLKVSEYGSTVYGVLRNVSTDDVQNMKAYAAENQLIQKYKDTAKATRTNVVMQVDTGFLVSIGSGGRVEVLTAVTGYKMNILVSNEANETIYRIANGTRAVRILPDRQTNALKLLDFTPIVHGDPLMVPKIEQDNNDLRFSFTGVYVLISGIADLSYEDLGSWEVILRETHLKIEKKEGVFNLVPPTILVKPEEHDTVVLHIPYLETGTKITTVDDSHPIKYELLKKGNDLVFTNLFQPDSGTSVATVIFQDFYNSSISALLTEKNLSIETTPGTFMSLTSDVGKNITTFEDRELEFQGPPSRKAPPRTYEMYDMEEMEMGPWEMSNFIKFMLPNQI